MRCVPFIAALFVLTAVSCFNQTDTKKAKGTLTTESSIPEAIAESEAPDSVVVYYFHGDRRCRTCKGIESAIERTIAERFAAEVASETLKFKKVNTDQEENAHFVKEYELSFSSMVVTITNKEQTTLKWHNSEKIWPLARDEAKLREYVELQIREYLAHVRST